MSSTSWWARVAGPRHPPDLITVIVDLWSTPSLLKPQTLTWFTTGLQDWILLHWRLVCSLISQTLNVIEPWLSSPAWSNWACTKISSAFIHCCDQPISPWVASNMEWVSHNKPSHPNPTLSPLVCKISLHHPRCYCWNWFESWILLSHTFSPSLYHSALWQGKCEYRSNQSVYGKGHWPCNSCAGYFWHECWQHCWAVEVASLYALLALKEDKNKIWKGGSDPLHKCSLGFQFYYTREEVHPILPFLVSILVSYGL